MVQVATSAKKIEIKPANFKNIKDIVEIQVRKPATDMPLESSKITTRQSAYRKQIEKIYPDAFVIAVKDNKILPLQEALEIKIRVNKYCIMKKISNEVKVGATALVTILVFIWFTVFLKGRDFFSNTTSSIMLFTIRLDGLAESSPVEINGYKVGVVQSIDFINDRKRQTCW